MMLFLVLVGVFAITSVIVIAVVETKRMEKGMPSLLERWAKKRG